MAISHLCLQCGFDLARVHLRRDPYYGLPMVHCPQCEAVAVRRRHPVWRGGRNGRRMLHSLSHLIFKGMVTVILISATTGSVTALFQWLMDGEIAGERLSGQYFIRYILPSFLILGIFTGFWLTVCFQHWRRRVWRTWLLLMYPALQITVLIVYHDMIGPPFRIIDGVLHFSWETILTYIFYPIPLYVFFLILMVVAVAGKPLGKGWLRYGEYRRRLAWCKRRRKLRLARTS